MHAHQFSLIYMHRETPSEAARAVMLSVNTISIGLRQHAALSDNLWYDSKATMPSKQPKHAERCISLTAKLNSFFGSPACRPARSEWQQRSHPCPHRTTQTNTQWQSAPPSLQVLVPHASTCGRSRHRHAASCTSLRVLRGA